MLSNEQRRNAAKRAADLLREERATWLQGYWLADISDIGSTTSIADQLSRDSDAYIASDSRMGKIREWFNRRQMRSANKRCGVCAEGALLLALIDDPEISDDAVASTLLSEFQEPACEVAIGLGFIEDDGDWDGIPELNDGHLDEEGAIGLLDGISKTI